MRQVVLLVLIALHLIACRDGKNDGWEVSAPHSLCSTMNYPHDLIRNPESDSSVIAWGGDASRVLVYVGYNPDFPGMGEAYKKHIAEDEIVLIGEIMRADSGSRLYGFRVSDDPVAYVHITVRGISQNFARVLQGVGDSLYVCKPKERQSMGSE